MNFFAAIKRCFGHYATFSVVLVVQSIGTGYFSV